MRDRLTTIIAIVLLAAVTVTSYWYARTLRIPKSISVTAPGTPDFEADKLVITQFDSEGRAKNKLFADRLLHYTENDNVDLTSPRLVSLRPDQPQIEVRAQRAQLENAGERVHLHGEVDVRRAAFGDTPALRVTTDYLLAIPDVDRYSTDRPVEVERGAARIRADGGMQLDNIARTARFDGNVRMLLPPAAPKDTQ
jgi:lipopolysaccharide export system protein LptC